jgi:hypothetical protein
MCKIQKQGFLLIIKRVQAPIMSVAKTYLHLQTTAMETFGQEALMAA